MLRGDTAISWLAIATSAGESAPPVVAMAPFSGPGPVRFWLDWHQEKYDGILGVSDELIAFDEVLREEFERRLEEMRPTVAAHMTAQAESQ